MNSAGVSLMPATMPIPTPAQRRLSDPSTSATTTARMTRLTCPSCSDSRTGSSQQTRPISSAPRPQSPAAVVIPSRLSERRTTSATNATFTASPSTWAVTGVTNVNGNEHSAANGV